MCVFITSMKDIQCDVISKRTAMHWPWGVYMAGAGDFAVEGDDGGAGTSVLSLKRAATEGKYAPMTRRVPEDCRVGCGS